MKLNIQVEEGAKAPTRGTAQSAGLDLYVKSREYDSITDTYTYHTGVHVEIPEGYVGLLVPRSSIYKKNLVQSNHVGIIDADYRGELMVKMWKRSGVFRIYEECDKFVQLVIVPCLITEVNIVSELSQSERGEGGFGHTDEAKEA